MTRDQATTQILALVPLTPAELDGFLGCDDQTRADLVVAYRNAGLIADASAWRDILAVLSACDALLSLVSPLTAAVMSSYAISKL